MSGEFDGYSSIVTGGGSGIGRAIATSLGAAGSRVAIFDRDVVAAQSAAASIRKAGGRADAHHVDVTDADSFQEAVDTVAESHGGVHHLVNNAGISGVRAPLWEISAADFDSVIALNMRSVWVGMKAALVHMRAAGAGAIVNVASTAGLIGYAQKAPYTAAKHAVIGLTKVAAIECRDSAVRINCVCPATVDTPLIQASLAGLDEQAAAEAHRLRAASQPLGRFGSAEEVADCVLFLLSDRASFISGSALAVDGSLLAGA